MKLKKKKKQVSISARRCGHHPIAKINVTFSLDAYVPSTEVRRIVLCRTHLPSTNPITRMSNPLKLLINIARCVTNLVKNLAMPSQLSFLKRQTDPIFLPDISHWFGMGLDVASDPFGIHVPYNKTTVLAACCQQRSSSIEFAVKNVAVLKSLSNHLWILLFPWIFWKVNESRKYTSRSLSLFDLYRVVPNSCWSSSSGIIQWQIMRTKIEVFH